MRKALLGALMVGLLGVAGSAQAQVYYQQAPTVVYQQPYYAPQYYAQPAQPTVVYQQPTVVYEQPAPVYYANAPVYYERERYYEPAVSLGFFFGGGHHHGWH